MDRSISFKIKFENSSSYYILESEVIFYIKKIKSIV